MKSTAQVILIFRYHGLAVFNPHFHIDNRIELAQHPEGLDGRREAE